MIYMNINVCMYVLSMYVGVTVCFIYSTSFSPADKLCLIQSTFNEVNKV